MLRQLITIVSGKQLVAAVAGQRHGDVLARHRRNEIGRDLRGIGERLVVPFRQARDNIERLTWRHRELGMFGPEMMRHRGGMMRLVIAGDVEADRECLDLAAARRLHQRDDG